MPLNTPPTIRIAAALLTDRQDRLILVRKRSTSAFMQPGGKIQPDETPLAALIRELHEELGLVVAPSSPRYLGCFAAPAAHEQGFTVEAELFSLSTDRTLAPAAEIAELIRFDPACAPHPELAPLTRDAILPLHRTRAGS